MSLDSQRRPGCCYIRSYNRKATPIKWSYIEFRVGTGHVAAQSMGLDPGPSPHPSDPTVGNPQMPGQLSGAPMSRAIGRGLFGRLENPGFLADDLLRDNLATMSGIKPAKRSLTKRSFHRATKS